MAGSCIGSCLIIVILSATAAYSQRCVEGQQSRRNNMYYVCRGGVDVPVACSTVDGIRVEPGTTYRTSAHLFTCQQRHSQLYVLAPTACMRNGQVINIGSSITEENFWHTCTQIGDQVQLKISGCVGEFGARIGPNGIVPKRGFLFRCAFSGDTVSLEAYGCVVEGSHYPAGQDIMSRDFWYQCNFLPGRGGLELKLAGCVENGQKLFNGSTVVRGAFVFRCEISGNQARFAAVGCVDDRGGHHMLGETAIVHGNRLWQEGPPPVSYMMECKKEHNRIFKQARQCYYQGADGQGPLDPNCVRRFGTTMVKCVRGSGNRIWGEVFGGASDQLYRDAINAGFRAC